MASERPAIPDVLCTMCRNLMDRAYELDADRTLPLSPDESYGPDFEAHPSTAWPEYHRAFGTLGELCKRADAGCHLCIIVRNEASHDLPNMTWDKTGLTKDLEAWTLNDVMGLNPAVSLIAACIIFPETTSLKLCIKAVEDSRMVHEVRWALFGSKDASDDGQ